MWKHRQCKGRECCCEWRTIIHRSAVESTISHKGVENGKSTTKGDGDGTTWSKSGSEERMHNLGQSYTSRERYENSKP